MNLRELIILLLIALSIVSCNQKSGIETDTDNQDSAKSEREQISIRLEKDSLNSDLHNKLAKIYNDESEYGKALNSIRKALELDSLNADYFITLADIYMNMTKIQNSLNSLEKAVELDPENIPALTKLAETYIVFRDYDQTAKYIGKVLELDNINAKAYYLKAIIFMETGDTAKAVNNFQIAVDIDQEYFEAYVQLGILFSSRNNKLAIDYYNNALNIQPDNLDVKYLLGMFYQETLDFDRAISLYNSILILNPEYTFAYYNIGYINLVYMQDFETAVKFFSDAIQSDPSYVDAYYNRGYSYELNGDYRNAINDYAKTMELSPNYPKAVEALNRLDKKLTQNQK